MTHTPHVSTPRPRENTPWLHRYRKHLLPGMLVLDLGCGKGDDAVDLVKFGCQVIALDYGAQRVRQVPDVAGIRLRVVADLVGRLPMRDRSIDAVVASLSLHYFDTAGTQDAILELARVLTDAGPLICRVNAESDYNFGYGQGEEVEPDVFRQPEGHLKRFFSPKSLEHFLEPCFTVERIVSRTILQRGNEKRTLECVARKIWPERPVTQNECEAPGS